MEFGSEISCHLQGNVSDLLPLHQKQLTFAKVYSLRYIKKKIEKNILSL